MADPRPRTVLTGEISASARARLSGATEVIQIGRATPPDDVRAALADAEAILNVGQYPITTDLLDLAPRLRVVSMRAVGYDSVDVAACAARGVGVCNTPGVLDGAVAELTVLLMLAVARNLRRVLDGAGGGLGGPQLLGRDLSGRSLGIIGMGRIGRRVADIARAGLGMRVRYTSRRELPDAPGERVSLDDLLRTSDVVSLHVPRTPETENLLGARELSLMKAGAFLINTSRGGLVDEVALYDAISSGRLGGAGLDTIAHEPVRPDEPLLALPNVLLTPHIGSATSGCREAMDEMAVTNVLAVLAGDPPLARVRA